MGEWMFGALRVTPQGVVALLSASTGTTALWQGPDPSTGWAHLADEWIVVDPDRRLGVLAAGGAAYVLARCRGANLYRLPLQLVGFPDADAHALTLVDGHPAVAVTTDDSVAFHDLHTASELRPPWHPPTGWTVDEVVSVRNRPYAWLERTSDHWQGWLWDPLAARPLRPPLRVVGFRRPVTDLAGRPALLTMVNWESYQVWDLSLGTPIGPPVPGTTPTLDATSLGVLHGRPVRAASTGTAVEVWDLLTATPVRTIPAVDEPVLATAIESPDRVHVLDAAGTLRTVPVSLRDVHPLARRSSRSTARR